MNLKNLFQTRHCRALFALAVLLNFSASARAAGTEPNTLTAEEKKAGWILLFDGTTFHRWRSYKKDQPAANWNIDNACLHNAHNGRGGGDLITKETYSDFELQWEWKIPAGANSGLKYFVTEDNKTPIGHEYQMIDDEHYKSPLRNNQRTGSLYDLLPANHAHPRPAGEFNQSRVSIHGPHIEHWLNGEKVVEYDLGSEDMKAAIAKSKFKIYRGFGEKIKGHILLQDHGDEAWFRNLKLRDLSAK